MDLSIPLWQNFSGRLSKANRDIVLAQNNIQITSATAKQIEIGVNAETAYWRIVSARENVRIAREALDRSTALNKFIVTKAKQDLRDESDVLQVQASLKSSEFDLKSAINEERVASFEFNRLRGQPADATIPVLANFKAAVSREIDLPKNRPGDRVDVLVSNQEISLAVASASAASEKNKPDVTLFGSYALNGRDDNQLSGAINNADSFGQQSSTIGIKLNMPLDFAAACDAIQGARSRVIAAETEFQSRRFNQDIQWNDLRQKYIEAKERSALSEEIVRAQDLKLKEARRLLKLGRSSLFTVLSFEQEYLRAEKYFLISVYEMLTLQVQSKLFQGRIP